MALLKVGGNRPPEKHRFAMCERIGAMVSSLCRSGDGNASSDDNLSSFDLCTSSVETRRKVETSDYIR